MGKSKKKTTSGRLGRYKDLPPGGVSVVIVLASWITQTVWRSAAAPIRFFSSNFDVYLFLSLVLVAFCRCDGWWHHITSNRIADDVNYFYEPFMVHVNCDAFAPLAWCESNVVKVKETWLHASREGMKWCSPISSLFVITISSEKKYHIGLTTRPQNGSYFVWQIQKVNIQKVGTCIGNHIVAPCDSCDWKLQANDCHVIPTNYEYLRKYSNVCIVSTKDSPARVRALFIQRAECTFWGASETTKEAKIKTKMEKMIFLKNALNFNEMRELVVRWKNICCTAKNEGKCKCHSGANSPA